MNKEMKTPTACKEVQSRQAEGAGTKKQILPFRLPECLLTGNDAETQQARLLAALRLGSVSTFEARQHLDIPHPGGRINGLRKNGFDIDTVMDAVPTTYGQTRRIGRYILRAEPEGKEASGA